MPGIFYGIFYPVGVAALPTYSLSTKCLASIFTGSVCGVTKVYGIVVLQSLLSR